MHFLTLATLATVGLADILTTWLGMRAGLPEINPVMDIFRQHAEWSMYIFRALLTATIMAVVVWRGTRYPRLWHHLRYVSALWLIVVVSNFVALL